MPRRAPPVIRIEISEILSIGEREACMVARESGRVFRVPINFVEFLPGAVMVPEWLAKKLRKQVK